MSRFGRRKACPGGLLGAGQPGRPAAPAAGPTRVCWAPPSCGWRGTPLLPFLERAGSWGSGTLSSSPFPRVVALLFVSLATGRGKPHLGGQGGPSNHTHKTHTDPQAAAHTQAPASAPPASRRRGAALPRGPAPAARPRPRPAGARWGGATAGGGEEGMSPLNFCSTGPVLLCVVSGLCVVVCVVTVPSLGTADPEGLITAGGRGRNVGKQPPGRLRDVKDWCPWGEAEWPLGLVTCQPAQASVSSSV